MQIARALLTFGLAYLHWGAVHAQCVLYMHDERFMPKPVAGEELMKDWVSKFPPTSQKWSIKQADTRVDDPAKALNDARASMEQESCFSAFTARRVAVFLNSLNVLGARGEQNPFPAIPRVFTQNLKKDDKKVALITVGWIPKNHPGLETTKEANDTWVIKVKKDHKGWPESAFGMFQQAKLDTKVGDALMDWVAGGESSEILGKWFWVVPNNSKLKRRLRIDLVEDDGKTVITSTLCSPTVCNPTPVSAEYIYTDKQGKEHTICGTTSACPQFYDVKGLRRIDKPQLRG